MRRMLPFEPLTAAAFRPFGDVIDVASASRHFTINEGYAERYDDLARIDVDRDGGRPKLSIFRAVPRQMPFALSVIERHPLGSQAFIPMSGRPYLVVVCEGGDAPELGTLRCFTAQAGQGVNYARGTWHHPLLALEAPCDFLVLDRAGEGENCDEVRLSAAEIWIGATGSRTCST
jgi:ureidoglycolate lyase